MGRYLRITADCAALWFVLLCALLCAGCAGGSADSAAVAGGGAPVGETAAPVGAGWVGLPSLPRDAYIDPAVVLARRGNVTASIPLTGNLACQYAFNTQIDNVAQQAAIYGGKKSLGWAMYEFSELAYEDAPLQITVEMTNTLPQNYYIGYSDYERGIWRWQKIYTPTQSATVGVSGGKDIISPGAKLYVVVAVYHLSAAFITNVTLGLNTVAPPVQDFQASDGTAGDSVILSWTALETSYPGLSYEHVRIERAPERSGPWTQVGEVGTGVTQFADVHSGVSNTIPYNTPMYYRARTVALNLPGCPCPVDTGYRLLSDVQNVQATDGTDPLAVSITWDTVAGADAYKIDYLNQTGGPPADWTPLITINGPVCSFSHTLDNPGGAGSQENVVYEYRIRAQFLTDSSLNWSAPESGYRKGIPVAGITATPDHGDVPLSVELDASGSYDPGGGEILSYQWDYDGDGTYDGSTGGTPTVGHVYGRQGVYQATVKVTDGEGDTGTASVSVTVNGFLHTWGNADDERTWAVAYDNGGNLFAAGQVYGGSTTGTDVLLLKYHPTLGLQWARSWGTTGTDIAYGLTCDGVGNAWLTGETDGTGAGGQDMLILAFSSGGELLVQRTWGSPGDDKGNAIVLANGFLYLAGQSTGVGQGMDEAVLIRLNSGFTADWQKAWGGLGREALTAICADSNNHIYVTGYSNSVGGGGEDVLTQAYTADAGSLWWSRYYGGAGDERGQGVYHDGANLHIGGWTESYGLGGKDALYLRLAETGGTQLRYCWGTAGDEQINGVGGTVAGAYLCGSLPDGMSNTDLLLLRYDVMGALTLAKAWGSAGSEEFANSGCYNTRFAMAGAAPSIDAVWYTPTGTVTASVGANGAATGTLSSISGTLTTPATSEVTLSGVEDTGGGGQDALVNVY